MNRKRHYLDLKIGQAPHEEALELEPKPTTFPCLMILMMKIALSCTGSLNRIR